MHRRRTVCFSVEPCVSGSEAFIEIDQRGIGIRCPKKGTWYSFIGPEERLRIIEALCMWPDDA